MNKVFLNKEGKLFINGYEIEEVREISVKTNYSGTNIVVVFNGEYQSEFNEESIRVNRK